MKRKHGATTAVAKQPAAAAKQQQRPAKAPAAAAKSSKPAAQAKPSQSMKFAQPMRPLDADSDDEEEEEPRHEVARNDRAHRAQIDADNDAAEHDDDEEMAEDDAEDSDQEDEEEAEDAAAEEEDQEEEEEAQADEDEEGEAAEEEEEVEEEEPEQELDLPIQLVQATYSGTMYGLKSREPVRTLQRIQRKLHSRRGIIEESDVHLEDEGEMAEDESAALAGATAAAAAAAAPTAAASATPAAAAPAAGSSSSSFGLLFTTSAHIGSVKSLSVSADGKWMVSGGLDETIRIYRTASMAEYGQLIHHGGSVTALQFFGSSHMLSGGAEGALCIWNTKDWSLAKKFEGAHAAGSGANSAGGVTSIGVHPSGRVALTVGSVDRQVKLWDLVKGSLASSRPVEGVFHTVAWASSGERYVLVGDRAFDVFDTSNHLLRKEQLSDTKILAAVFLGPNLLALGCEDKTIRIHAISTGECVLVLRGAHAQRVRGLDALSMLKDITQPEGPKAHFLASASTDGQTHLWDLTELVEAADADSESSPAAPKHDFHPICSSLHDQRVVLLKFLPQWRVRKEIAQQLLKPVQTKEAEQKQKELMEKKQKNKSKNQTQHDEATTNAKANQQQKGAKGPAAAPLSKADRAAASLEKSKKLALKRAAALSAEKAARLKMKAKRTLAKNNPHATGLTAQEEEAVSGSAAGNRKKKDKATFEEAPLEVSDDDNNESEAPQAKRARIAQQQDDDEEDDDDEQEGENEPMHAAHAKLAATGGPKHAAAVAAAKAAAAAAAARPAAAASNSKPKLSAAQLAQANKKPAAPGKAAAGAKPAAAAVAAEGSDDDDDEEGGAGGGHSGFSAALPMFRPQLHQMQRKKKQSAKKVQRDKERRGKMGAR